MSHPLSCRYRHPEDVRHRVGRIPGCTRAPYPSLGVPSLTRTPIIRPVLPGLRALRWLPRWPEPPAEEELTRPGEEEPVEEGRKLRPF